MNQLKNQLKSIAPVIVFLAALLWATDSPFRSHLTQDLSSLTIVTWEHLLDVIFCLPLFFLGYRELKSLSLKQWLGLVFIGAGSSALALLAFTESFRFVSPSVALLLQKLQPFVAVALSWVFLKERLGRKFWLWSLVAILAAYLITFANIVPRMYEGEVLTATTKGVLLALSASVLWAAGTVAGKGLLRNISFKTVTAGRFGFGFIFLFIWNFFSNNTSQLFRVTSTDLSYLLTMALLSGVFALFVYYWALRYTKASIATIAELGYPLTGIIINWLVLGISLTTSQMVGTLGLLTAVYFLTKENKDGNS